MGCRTKIDGVQPSPRHSNLVPQKDAASQINLIELCPLGKEIDLKGLSFLRSGVNPL